MLRDSYNVEFEATATRSNEPSLLRENTVQRDKGWSWVILFAAFSTLFITNGIHTSFGILYAALLSHFKSGREETAWIGSISLGLLCFFSPIASLLIEQIGCRATSVIGAFLCSLGFLLSSFATGITLLYFTHGVLFGLGTSLTYTAAMTVVTRSFERKRNIATGLCASGSQFGGISLAPLSQVLFDRLGYANTFRTFSGLLLLVAISSLAYKPELVESRTLDSAPKKSPKEMLVVWKNKAYVVWALSTTMVTLGYNVPRYTLVKYAMDLGISKDASAWLLSYLCASSAIGRIVFGRICEWVPQLYLCQACVVGCAVGAILFPFLKSYVALAIACFVFGLPDGGFVASLPMITTEIVGTQRMVEGFGFVLFCQSYSNVIGPPLSGMLYDTYQSYLAAFCFAAVPQVIGVVMMCFIPFYTQNQINYRREIGLSSNSGIMVEDNINITSSPSPVSENTIPHEPTTGNYNIIINIPVPAAPSDISQVNVIIKNTPTETSFLETASNTGEISSNNNQIIDQGAEQTSGSICDAIKYIQNTASNTTIVAPECISAAKDENIENILQSTGVCQEVIALQLSHISQDGFGLSLTQENNTREVVENPCEKEFSFRKTSNEGYLSVCDETNTSTLGPDTKTTETVAQNIMLTIPSHLLVAETILDVPIKSQEDSLKGPDEFLNNDIANLIPKINASDKSIPSMNSSIKFLIPSNTAFVPGATEEVETIINLTGESPLPRLIALPQPNCATMRSTARNVNDSEFTVQTNELNYESPVVPQVTTNITGTFTSSLESFVQDNSSCSPDLVFAGDVAIPSGFSSEGTRNQNASSLMASAGISGTFPLVHDQLPEPLKPTSVCSVSGNVHAPTNGTDVGSGNLEKTSASSPLSSELSTVIADVIQSLTSQHTGTQKPNKESTISSVANNSPTSQAREHGPKSDSSQMHGKMETRLDNQNVGCCKESIGSARVQCTDGNTRSTMQTSVLHSMQSIVAEGYPEDFALLEDISIDLSLDKDPSVASIVLGGNDVPVQQLIHSGHHDGNTDNLLDQISLAPTSKSNIPFVTMIQDSFSPNTPILNVFAETLGTQQNIDTATAAVTQAANSIDSTNPFLFPTM